MDDRDTYEQYVCALIHVVLPDREFEYTTMTPGLYGNYVRGIRTLDIYALLHATPEQRAQARAIVDAERERYRLWREQVAAAELAAKQARGYPY